MKQFSPLYQRLLAFIKPYLWPFVALMAAGMLILAGTEGLVVVLLKYLGDQVTIKHDFHAVELISAGIFGLFTLRAIAEFGSDYLEAYVTQKITLDLRARLNGTLQDKPLSFFNQTPTGVILSRVINDVQVTTGGAVDSLFGAFSSATRLLTVLAAAIYLDWQLALGALVVFPVAVLPIARISRHMRKMSKDSQKQLSGLAVLLQEAFQGNRVVKAFGMEEYERARFHRELRRLFRISLRVARIKALTGPMIEVLGAYCQTSVIVR